MQNINSSLIPAPSNILTKSSTAFTIVSKGKTLKLCVIKVVNATVTNNFRITWNCFNCTFIKQKATNQNYIGLQVG